ncbi:cell division protein ZapA [Moraxella sp. FZLJ2107]|uniref:cell division protein ZapA n=1 Tax=unclassified Moraxella TaxID=2685852 RepID=UPI0020C92D6D|nr:MULTISPECIES: cell division protein ZapA [unclassified Moraxella]UTO04950.1 cell division protein ZapA [Moraxella sp. FZLJ2107]UTO21684.1 cell division protein ZapA [Moraxella sp. FZLJ2109]
MSQETTTNPQSAIIAKEEFRPVDISIAGTPHRIVCPVDEIKNLENGAEFINQKIRDLRREIKHKTPSNEEFLVLVCLDLYDQIQGLQNQVAANAAEQKQIAEMIEKINKQARSML